MLMILFPSSLAKRALLESVFGSAPSLARREQDGKAAFQRLKKQQKSNGRREENHRPTKTQHRIQTGGCKQAQTTATKLTMTVAASSPSPTNKHPPNHSVPISLGLLAISFFLTLYTHNTCPASELHTPCTTPNNLILGLAVFLAYLAAVGVYTSPDGRVLFPLLAVSYFCVLGVLVLLGLEDLRAGLGCILGVEVVVVAVFLGLRMMMMMMMWCGSDGRKGRAVDEEEARLMVDEGERCGGSGGGGEDEAALLGQTTRGEEKKGNGRVDDGGGGGCVREVTESKLAE